MGFQCKVCQKILKSSQGLKSHITRLHKCSPSSEIENSEVFSQSSDSSSEVPFVDLLSNLKSNLPILRRIPKGARSSAAKALSDTIEICLRDNTVESWERLLLFPAMCLRVPMDQEKRQVSLTTMVKSNIGKFIDGAIIRRLEPRQFNAKSTGHTERLSKCVVSKLSDGDVTGAVRLLSSEDTFAPRNPETVKTLVDKHPPHDQQLICPIPSDGVNLTPLSVKEEDVRSAVTSFPAGSAGGLDMLRPQHLKDLLGHGTGSEGDRLCVSLTKLCNTMLSGGVPAEICPVLYGASLCALKKKDGGIRPIAVGSTFRRLVAKMGCARIAGKLGAKLQPVQLGFGVKGGVEAASHAARRFVGHHHSDAKVFLKIDFANAFNMVRRDVVLQSVLDWTPELYSFLSQCYSLPSHLAFGEEIIPSLRGIQQGDPLGPALFCMVVHPIAQAMKSEFNVWFLDDASLGGSPDVVLQDFVSLKERSAELGLEINFSKCELFCLEADGGSVHSSRDLFQKEVPSVRCPPPNECLLLGSPLTEAAMEGSLGEKIRALKLVSDRLTGIPAHCAFYILKNSLAIPKLVHILRCAPTWKCFDSLLRFDSTLKTSVESITNISLSEAAWEQSSWPVSEGGLGIRHVSDLAVTAFLSSTHSTGDLVKKILPQEVAEVFDHLWHEGVMEWRGELNLQPPPVDRRGHQCEWEGPKVTISINRLREQAANPKEKARLIGVSSKESGAFLNALPSAPLGTLLADDAFRIAVGLRLGANIGQPHECMQCGASVDQSGTHGLSCKMSKGRFSRHASVNDVIKRALNSAGIPSILEPSYLSRTDNKRPDGISQIPWKGGKSVIWDFTCTDSLAPSYVDSASTAPLFAASCAERNKKAKYSNLSQQHIFIPVAVECLGAFGQEGRNFIREIGRRICSVTGEKRAGEYLLQRISVAVQRGNAISVLGSIPEGVSMDECFSLL